MDCICTFFLVCVVFGAIGGLIGDTGSSNRQATVVKPEVKNYGSFEEFQLLTKKYFEYFMKLKTGLAPLLNGSGKKKVSLTFCNGDVPVIMMSLWADDAKVKNILGENVQYIDKEIVKKYLLSRYTTDWLCEDIFDDLQIAKSDVLIGNVFAAFDYPNGYNVSDATQWAHDYIKKNYGYKIEKNEDGLEIYLY